MRASLAAVLCLIGCSGTGTQSLPQLPPVPAEATGPQIHSIHPAVLRGLMFGGELTIVPDEETRAAMTASETRIITALVSICLDTEGMATLSLAARSRYDAFNQAVLAAVGGWRFRPYVRDGRPSEACSTATFRYDVAAAATEPALPESGFELPPGDLGVWTFPPESVTVPATPGVALAQICRRPRRREPPDVTFLQSSGNPATDRALLDEREVVIRNEDISAGTICRLRSMLTRVPEPAELRKKPAIEREVKPDDLVRIAGNPNIVPGDGIKDEMRADKVARVSVPVKLCLDRTGRPADVEVIGSSGYIPYDADLVNAVASWRYEPLVIDGAPVRACTVIQFIYRQKN